MHMRWQFTTSSVPFSPTDNWFHLLLSIFRPVPLPWAVVFPVFLDSSSKIGMEQTRAPLCWEEDSLDKDLEAAVAKRVVTGGDRHSQS